MSIYSNDPVIPAYWTDFPASRVLDPDSDLCWFGKCSHNVVVLKKNTPHLTLLKTYQQSEWNGKMQMED